MTHVTVIPADRGGCGYYRLAWPAQAVARVRPEWTIEIRPAEKVEVGTVKGKIVGVRGLDPLPDLLVIQRVGTAASLHVQQWAQQNGVKVVVDFDDAMWCIDRKNRAWTAWNMGTGTGQHWRTCEVSAGQADLVTVTTDALARHYSKQHHRVEVIPNRVPAAATMLPSLRGEYDDTMTAGWAGFTLTHPDDCKVSAPAAKAFIEAGRRLRVVADAPGAARDWGLDPAQVDAVPRQNIGPDYYSSLSTMDLMLVGLRDTPFNQAKSFLKVLEAGAAGVPSIASDTKPHRLLARLGYPLLLASNPRQWAEHAKRFLDTGFHHEFSEAVRKETQDLWTIEGNAEDWAQAWERAMK